MTQRIAVEQILVCATQATPVIRSPFDRASIILQVAAHYSLPLERGWGRMKRENYALPERFWPAFLNLVKDYYLGKWCSTRSQTRAKIYRKVVYLCCKLA